MCRNVRAFHCSRLESNRVTELGIMADSKFSKVCIKKLKKENFLKHSLWIRFYSSGFVCLGMISVAFWTFEASGNHNGRSPSRRCRSEPYTTESLIGTQSKLSGALSFVPKGTMPLSAGSCTRSGITAHCLFGAQNPSGQIPRVITGRSHQNYSLELRVRITFCGIFTILNISSKLSLFCCFWVSGERTTFACVSLKPQNPFTL